MEMGRERAEATVLEAIQLLRENKESFAGLVLVMALENGVTVQVALPGDEYSKYALIGALHQVGFELHAHMTTQREKRENDLAQQAQDGLDNLFRGKPQ